jgi:DNA uptake protein ComE-like DNA-binding protein
MAGLLLGLMLAAHSPATTPQTTLQTTQRSADLIDINRAGSEELKTLPGIADAYANAIIRNRPYKNKAQLLSHKVIPRAAYAKIKALIIARQ